MNISQEAASILTSLETLERNLGRRDVWQATPGRCVEEGASPGAGLFPCRADRSLPAWRRSPARLGWSWAPGVALASQRARQCAAPRFDRSWRVRLPPTWEVRQC